MTDKYSLKLYYFNIAAKGECIRLALTYLGIPFEDYRFADRDEFMAMKASGKLMFGQVPALEVTDKTSNSTVLLTQTAAILRFVSKLSDGKKCIYPSDPIKAAQVDAITDQEADAYSSCRVLNYSARFGFEVIREEGNEKILEKATEAVKGEVMPRHFKLLTDQLNASKTGWIAGTDEPSLAEFHWMSSFEWFDGKMFNLADYPEIKAWIERFYSLPEIKAYKNN